MAKTTDTYAPFFKGWAAKQLGAKPDAALLDTVHGLGLRPGKQALACAMAMRDSGVSGAQVVMACGAPQNNRRRGLIAAGLVKAVATPANEQGHTVYRITLTPKGEAAIKRRADAAAKAALNGDAPKAAKPKRAAAKRKPKATPAPAPQGDAPQGDAPQTPQGDAPQG